MNNTYNQTIRATPFEMLYGRPYRFPLDTQLPHKVLTELAGKDKLDKQLALLLELHGEARALLPPASAVETPPGLRLQQETLAGIHDGARAAIARAKEVQTDQTPFRPIQFHENELVMKYSPLLAKKGETLKLLSRWSGPWMVLRFHPIGKSCDIQHTVTGETMSTHVSLLARTWTDDDAFFAPTTVLSDFADLDSTTPIDAYTAPATPAPGTNADPRVLHAPSADTDVARSVTAALPLRDLLDHYVFFQPRRLLRIDEVRDGQFGFGRVFELMFPAHHNPRQMWLRQVFYHPTTFREAFHQKPHYLPLTTLLPRTALLFSLPTFTLPADFQLHNTLPVDIRHDIHQTIDQHHQITSIQRLNNIQRLYDQR
jgi:hypothetical protein